MKSLIKEYRRMNGLPDKLQEKQVNTETVKDPATFDYIEAAVMDRVKPDLRPRDKEREKAKEQSRTFIAGFPVNDPDKEKKALDDMIEARNASVRAFIADRKHARGKLEEVGIKPLAVVPSKAWADICQKAELIVLSPNNDGKAVVSRAALARYGSAAEAERAAARSYPTFVKSLFPTVPENGMLASVILPTPPQDVADILLKAKGFSLHVAAVPEAIRFTQTPTDLYKGATQHSRDEWAQRQGYADYADWVRRDPIVFWNHGTASAVIAQFGDFPIEKKVVDIVMEGDSLIPEKVGEAMLNPQGLDAANQYLQQQVASENWRQLMAAQQNIYRQYHPSGGAGSWTGR